MPLDLRRPSPSLPAARRRRAESSDDGADLTTAEQGGGRQLERDLRLAIAQKKLAVLYQPRMELDSGTLAGAEALLRWPHRRHGLVGPATFLPIAERTGLAGELGAQALTTACRQAADWAARQGGQLPIVAINVGPLWPDGALLLRQIGAALESSGLAPERLEIGLGEGLLAAVNTDALLLLSAIRDLGVGLALDDFGTGYASLTVLKRLPLTAIKVDRTLIRELPDNREEAAIIRAIAQTGQALDVALVAEGVETEAQRAFLSAVGFQAGQGALFGPAMSGAALDRCARPASAGAEASAPAAGLRREPGRMDRSLVAR